MSADIRSDRPAITVVGSANLDVVAPVTRHPRPGETVIGGDHYRATGGKGANQAVACARLGARTRFVGCVGDDDAGRSLTRAMREDGIDLEHLAVLSTAPSGLALIVVDEVGENTIVVSPGANARLGAQHVAAASVGTADAVLLQLEIPLEAVVAAADAARALVVLNPAPATSLPSGLLHRVDVLVPNRGELALLAGTDAEPESIDEVVDLARTLQGPQQIVVTLGSAGAVAIGADDVDHVPARRIEAIDATGAGDAFCGALTVALTEGADLDAATRWANVAASLAVGRRGAQPSLPTRQELETAAGSDAVGIRKDTT